MNTITITLPSQQSWDRLDPSRRELVKELCGVHGRTLLNFLLISATYSSDQEQIALVSGYQLSDLANFLGWKLDTLNCYIAVFAALNLLEYRQNCDHALTDDQPVDYRIPLGPYVPLTNLDALDDLCKLRKKQCQLAMKVKALYQHHYAGSSVLAPSFDDAELAQAQEQLFQQGLATTRTLLEQNHVEPSLQRKLQVQIADLLARSFVMGRMARDLQLQKDSIQTSSVPACSVSSPSTSDTFAQISTAHAPESLVSLPDSQIVDQPHSSASVAGSSPEYPGYRPIRYSHPKKKRFKNGKPSRRKKQSS